jgi:hypothetical protein
MVVRLSALCAGRPLTPGRSLVLISVRGWVNTRAMVGLEELGPLKKTNNIIGNRIRYLSACSIMPQSTTLPRAPQRWRKLIKNLGYDSRCVVTEYLSNTCSGSSRSTDMFGGRWYCVGVIVKIIAIEYEGSKENKFWSRKFPTGSKIHYF